MDPSLFNTGGPTGMMPASGLDELQKALTAGYGTDVSTLTGGAALRVQSLDHAMQATIQENKHFRLFNKLPKPKATATVDEWTEQSDVGGFLGGSTNQETGIINQATGDYARRVGLVKFLMTQRQVSFVQSLQGAITDSEAVEYNNGAKQLVSDAEFLSFEGDSTVVPTEFDGIYAQINAGINAGQVDPANIIDVKGQSLSGIDLINQGAAQIAGFGNFGTPTDLFLSNLTQADFDTGLDPAFRVALDNSPNSIALGTRVRALNTSFGAIDNNPDVFIRDSNQLTPFETRYPSVANTQVGIRPAAVAVAVANDASSTFSQATAGMYYWHVAGVNAAGQSTGVITAQMAIGAGQSATLTITRSAGGLETGYVISRSRLNGGGVLAGSVPGQGSDFREQIRIPASGGATTVWTDEGVAVPGCSRAYMLNMSPGDTAIVWRQMLPMLRFNLYPTNAAVIPWAQLLFGYLRISKRKHMVVYKNVLPNKASWRPFNV